MCTAVSSANFSIMQLDAPVEICTCLSGGSAALIDSGLPLRCADSLALDGETQALDGETHTDDGPGGLGPGPGLGPAPARMHSEPVDVVSGVTPLSSCGQ